MHGDFRSKQLCRSPDLITDGSVAAETRDHARGGVGCASAIHDRSLRHDGFLGCSSAPGYSSSLGGGVGGSYDPTVCASVRAVCISETHFV